MPRSTRNTTRRHRGGRLTVHTPRYPLFTGERGVRYIAHDPDDRNPNDYKFYGTFDDSAVEDGELRH